VADRRQKSAPPVGLRGAPPGKVTRDKRKSIASLLRNTHRLYSRGLLKLIREAGVTTIMQWWVLRQLWNEDGQTQRALSENIGLFDSGMVAVLNGLEEKGLVVRQRNAEDRRKVNVYLTKSGRALERKLLPLADRVSAAAIQGLADGDREHLWSMLNQLNDNLESYLAKDLS
jgi:DNA-binding MarR family transcriptional regulator